MKDIGGSITGDLTAISWPSGITVVAGLGTDGFVQATRFLPADGTWGPWRDVSPEKALGTAGMVARADAEGHLYYTNTTGSVIELISLDAGATWT